MIRNALKRLSLSYKIMAWNTACRNSDLLCKDFAWIQMILQMKDTKAGEFSCGYI